MKKYIGMKQIEAEPAWRCSDENGNTVITRSLFRVQPYLQMKCVDGSFQMWLASQSDILAEDWPLSSDPAELRDVLPAHSQMGDE